MNPGQEERAGADASIKTSSITLATVAAGPLFLLGVGIGLWADDPGAARTIDLTGSIIPAIVAVLPNLLGASLMTWLGNRNEAARMPVMWALAGALACAFFVMAVDYGPAGTRSTTTLVAFTFTGACCALICRRRIIW